MIETEIIEVDLYELKFVAKYNPINVEVLSISLEGINCSDYMGDIEYNSLHEDVQEIVSMVVD